ncbi:GH3 auxin-responsive promoter family protein [Flavobacterium branchiophilum]|uniref:GH3 auxin-responsive promoter n=1 Tax=Flavobacterium branchiophilum TaxID=55197 RepID=A0A2H3KIT4_9FLAO|nr:GH3 auxin-responsive promoter family protein [Flavobacterium branchiophilum]PDS21828.1 hypothetical protein B0A77_14980 [Flavobacterium branchiophilum]
MSFKSIAAQILAQIVHIKTQKWAQNPVETQQKVFKSLIKEATNTTFGKKHHFSNIKNYDDFVNQVPINDYEEIKPYIEKIIAGQKDVLWKGKPLYFAKTSGTTSGAKYIPLTKESLPYHIQAARNAILSYIYHTKKSKFVDGKMIFLQGSPELHQKNGINFGRLSGIVAHYVPKYLQNNRMPSWETNCIDDWETKVNQIVKETVNQDMTVISGIPSWVQMYFEKINEKTDKNISEVFKNFDLFIYGGVNFEPYKHKFEKLIGKKVDSIELFPASEGFFAYQDNPSDDGMLLLLNSGIFYEFIKLNEFYDKKPKRYPIGTVEIGVDYVLIISTNAGLWAYNMGDTVRFTSLSPHRVVVSGRVKHFISAFGEHVIGKEVECALNEALLHSNISINEFTVAPQITPDQGLPYHEWLIEFENIPEDIVEFALHIDTAMRKQNIYYDDLITGKVLRKLIVTPVPKNGFQHYMKSIGKLGGQNKIPRLSNDRKIADMIYMQNNIQKATPI